MRLLAFFVLSMPFFCLSARADLGFWPVQAGVAPAPVIASAEKALEFWMGSGAFHQIPASEFTKIEAKINAKSSGEIREIMLGQVNLAEIRLCRRHHLSICLLSGIVSRGSGFVIQDQVLVSAKHFLTSRETVGGNIVHYGLAEFFHAQSKLWQVELADSNLQNEAQREMAAFRDNPFRQLALVVTDSQFNLVFDSSKQRFQVTRYGDLGEELGVPIAGEFYGSTSFLAAIPGDSYAAVQPDGYSDASWVSGDVVHIRMTDATLPSLVVAQSGCEVNSPSFVAGYPNGTSTRANYGAPDAIDSALAITKGHFISKSMAHQLGQTWPGNDVFLGAQTASATLLCDNDGASGISGGMILNAKGEVCGLYKATVDRPTQTMDYSAVLKKYLIYSVGVKIN